LLIPEDAKTIELKSIDTINIAVPTIKNINVESNNDTFELSTLNLSLSTILNILAFKMDLIKCFN
jgi:hypothetical protein